MERFLIRPMQAREAADNGTAAPMPQGAREVHHAIDKPGKTDDAEATPQTMNPKLRNDEAFCTSCNQIRNNKEGFWIGKKKKKKKKK